MPMILVLIFLSFSNIIFTLLLCDVLYRPYEYIAIIQIYFLFLSFLSKLNLRPFSKIEHMLFLSWKIMLVILVSFICDRSWIQ